jgi:hypothetical protein
MLKKDGMRSRCPNRNCNWSMASHEMKSDGSAPQCVCGTEMKRVEIVRVFTYLAFLRGEDPTEEGVWSKE